MILDFPFSALLEIDVQNDFCPGGALAVAGGDEVILPLNSLAGQFATRGGKVIATADWHPAAHVSFAASHPGKKAGELIDIPGVAAGKAAGRAAVSGQVLWPVHCVRGSAGAAFHGKLDTRPVHFIVRKGYRENLDSYSAFFENDRKTPTGLDGLLKGLGIKTVVLGGLATDYCVFYSAMDAAALGYKTIVLKDAVRGVGFPEGSVERAFAAMEKAGILSVNSADIQGADHG